MKNIIVYFSHSGNNEKLAYELKKRTGCEIFQVCEKNKRRTISIMLDTLFKRNSKLRTYLTDLKKYQKVIFVAPVWNGKIATPMRAFMEQEKHNLNEFSYVTVCNGETGQKEKISDELLSITDRRPHIVTELSINSLLPEEQRHKVKYTFNYRINTDDLLRFNQIIESFINNIDCNTVTNGENA